MCAPELSARYDCTAGFREADAADCLLSLAVAGHSDQMFRQQPATLSTLFCNVAPHHGGGTSFCSTVAGYAALPPELKAEAEQLACCYSRADSPLTQGTVSVHPLVLEHPTRERRSLYLGTHPPLSLPCFLVAQVA